MIPISQRTAILPINRRNTRAAEAERVFLVFVYRKTWLTAMKEAIAIQ